MDTWQAATGFAGAGDALGDGHTSSVSDFQVKEWILEQYAVDEI